jgi:hypothetical protein
MIATFALENFDRDMVRVLSLEALDFDPTVSGQFYK